VGTINPVKAIIRLAHAPARSLTSIAVHYGPHGLHRCLPRLDCDFPRLLDLPNSLAAQWEFFSASANTCSGCVPIKVRPLTDAIPNRWEWGTLNHECIAGITACVDYIADNWPQG